MYVGAIPSKTSDPARGDESNDTDDTFEHMYERFAV
jgi:hypothetical protein